MNVGGRLVGVTLLGLAAVAGCATSGTRPAEAPERRTSVRVGSRATAVLHTEGELGEQTLSDPPSEVWAAMPWVFEQLAIPITQFDNARMEIGNPNWRARRIEGRRMSTYLDCGTSLSGPLADTHDVTMMVSVQVQPGEGGGSKVSVVSDAFARPRAVSGNQVHCVPNRILDNRVAELLRERLGG